MGHLVTALAFMTLLGLSAGLPPRKNYTSDIKNECRYGNKVCKKAGNEEKCGDRYKQCPIYANKALDVVWSFCMYANEENLSRCEEQMKVEWERIIREIRSDSWRLDFK